MSSRLPNIVFAFADQWRYQATGFGGDPNVRTPCLDRLSESSLNFANCISGSPVCCPARASLLTGQFPLTHGVFLNDVQLPLDRPSMGQAFAQAGYDTAWIGKWHIDGRGRSSYIPPDRRRGFAFWRAQECCHSYNQSRYWTESGEERTWDGYDATAQTREACRYIQEHARGPRPFLLVLSWGPPHNPYQTAPQQFRRMYDPQRLVLRPNVPAEYHDKARTDLAGYYAHCSALDECVGMLVAALDQARIAEDTILAFWSDHGDMLYSQGAQRKQQPWEESVRVPLLVRYPAALGRQGRMIDAPIDTPDLLPTLCDLAGVAVPAGVQGVSHCAHLRDGAAAARDAVLLACYAPFGEWTRKVGGREYRGVRTRRYTYARSLDGPWLLYDNAADPYQMKNLVNDADSAAVRADLEARLAQLLAANGDRFESGWQYIRRWGYPTDADGTVPYTQ